MYKYDSFSAVKVVRNKKPVYKETDGQTDIIPLTATTTNSNVDSLELF